MADARLSATELTDLFEHLDRLVNDGRQTIAESRKLRAANRRLFAQIQGEHDHE
jgi:hypothetical protein